MKNYRKSAHCTYNIKYHLVWITKYRKPVITGQIAVRTRELIRMICQSIDVPNPTGGDIPPDEKVVYWVPDNDITTFAK